jgi:hypothetical protein
MSYYSFDAVNSTADYDCFLLLLLQIFIITTMHAIEKPRVFVNKNYKAKTGKTQQTRRWFSRSF